jgi:hypothetical protein
MKFQDSFEEFQRHCEDYRGCHVPMPRLPDPPEPELGLSFLQLRWHVREYLCSKSTEERLAITLAKKRWD